VDEREVWSMSANGENLAVVARAFWIGTRPPLLAQRSRVHGLIVVFMRGKWHTLSFASAAEVVAKRPGSRQQVKK